MEKIIKNCHAEIAPQLSASQECWYLPMFSVYHPKKPESVRVVFDASAVFNGNSLNKVLLKGPDLTNSLLGILFRFRKEAVAITADVEQMFYNFKVVDHHRDFLRFIWHTDIDISKSLIDYRMTVHVFGNSPSPSVATYGLRKSVETADADVKNFVEDNFYVDDGLVSCLDIDTAVDLVKRTQIALYAGGSLRLHKIASNNKQVLQQFSVEELAKNLKDLSFDDDILTVQRSLGMSWAAEKDCFTFQVTHDLKPFSKRSVLSTINGLFDPIGFSAPVALRGKLLLREMMISLGHIEWDAPLPDTFRQSWDQWVNSLSDLEQCSVPRMYSDISFVHATDRQVHIFCDASKDAISAVAYLRICFDRHVTVSFLIGKSKVAPHHGITIPRLELCSAVLAIELAELIEEHLGFLTHLMFFYTDSRVVLGYLTNETKRVYVYVGNRVRRIRASSGPRQWKHVSTELNPADVGTRGIKSAKLENSVWIHGPKFLRDDNLENSPESHELIDAENDKELRPDIQCVETSVSDNTNNATLDSERFKTCSHWKRLVRAISLIKAFVQRWKFRGMFGNTIDYNSLEALKCSEEFILKSVQSEVYSQEIQHIENNDSLPKGSSIVELTPFLDNKGLLRVGGRLSNCNDLSNHSKHPIILPKRHYVSELIVRYFHEKNFHQGRSITQGSIRTAGFWIVGVRRLVTSLIHSCVTCKKLRSTFVCQKMADLPHDRLKPSPPFTFVGVDTFGPWPVSYRRTRGVPTNQKRWALLFTCLVCRAIHIEVIEELSCASFINALRRFIALRGPVRQFRSDRGTNFVSGASELNMETEFVEKSSVKSFLTDNSEVWKFNNSPHSSHMGGVWERMIGVARKILDSMLLKEGSKNVSHEVLTTLLAEVTAIVNSRPLVPISTDPEFPCVLSPARLLTQKSQTDNLSIPSFGIKDMLKSQWKQAQVLAQEFWSQWSNQYLHRLQTRQKWTKECRNISEGDIVLLRDKEMIRNKWPLGVIEKTFPSSHSNVRKVQVRVVREGKPVSYVRPVTELILLIESEC